MSVQQWIQWFWILRKTKTHLTSWLYTLLLNEKPLPSTFLKLKWEKDLHTDIEGDTWRQICTSVHDNAISSRTQESHYKMLSYLYSTPDRLHHIHKHFPPTCWRCHSKKGTLLHIFLLCSSLTRFCKVVHDKLKLVSSSNFHFLSPLNIYCFWINAHKSAEAKRSTSTCLRQREPWYQIWKFTWVLSLKDWYTQIN